jgi:signal transduction histidine kinase
MANIKEYLEKSKENIRREIKTLQTVLSTTRLENNRSQINFEKVDLRDVVNDSLEAFGGEAKKKGLEVNIVLPPEGALDVWGGREQVQEIMDNLLSNAVKYTAKGKIRVKVEKDGDFLRMSVADTGEGIPEEEVQNLGKKFHRVNPYVDNHSNGENLSVVRPGGTGIGLYVVTGFLNAMGGRLEVQSEVGKGSNFIAVMPIYNGQDSKRNELLKSVSLN